MLNNSIVPFPFPVSNFIRDLNVKRPIPLFPRLHQLSNSLSSTWLFSNLFNLCKMAISAANLFKLVASSVPFYFLFSDPFIFGSFLFGVCSALAGYEN